MEILLSAEMYGKAEELFDELCERCSARLSLLKDKSYGDELTVISIISIIMPDEIFEEGDYRERILFRKKKHNADVQLRIPWKSFIICNPEDRKRLYVDHIIRSIVVLKGRVSPNFEMERLLSDVRSALTDDDLGIPGRKRQLRCYNKYRITLV